MITPQDFVRQWQDRKLALLHSINAHGYCSYDIVKFDAEDVNTLQIAAASKSFLVEAGLPQWACEGYRFATPYVHFPPLLKIRPQWPDCYRNYRLFAANGISYDCNFHEINYICFDENTDGNVVLVDGNRENEVVTLLNSSVIQLAEYFLVLRQYMEWEIENCLRDNYFVLKTQKALETGNRLREIDPAAAANKDAWGTDIWEIENLMI